MYCYIQYICLFPKYNQTKLLLFVLNCIIFNKDISAGYQNTIEEPARLINRNAVLGELSNNDDKMFNLKFKKKKKRISNQI
jgi:hypothetical protein